MRLEEIHLRDPFVLPFDNKYYLEQKKEKYYCFGLASDPMDTVM